MQGDAGRCREMQGDAGRRLGLLEAAMRHDEVEELATAHLLRGRGRDGARARAGARVRARIRFRVSERVCSVTR